MCLEKDQKELRKNLEEKIQLGNSVIGDTTFSSHPKEDKTERIEEA